MEKTTTGKIKMFLAETPAMACEALSQHVAALATKAQGKPFALLYFSTNAEYGLTSSQHHRNNLIGLLKKFLDERNLTEAACVLCDLHQHIPDSAHFIIDATGINGPGKTSGLLMYITPETEQLPREFVEYLVENGLMADSNALPTHMKIVQELKQAFNNPASAQNNEAPRETKPSLADQLRAAIEKEDDSPDHWPDHREMSEEYKKAARDAVAAECRDNSSEPRTGKDQQEADAQSARALSLYGYHWAIKHQKWGGKQYGG